MKFVLVRANPNIESAIAFSMYYYYYHTDDEEIARFYGFCWAVERHFQSLAGPRCVSVRLEI